LTDFIQTRIDRCCGHFVTYVRYAMPLPVYMF